MATIESWYSPPITRSITRLLNNELREHDETCAICWEEFDEPIMFRCLHQFCKYCINTYIESCSHQYPCPLCKRRLVKISKEIKKKPKTCSRKDKRFSQNVPIRSGIFKQFLSRIF